MQPSLKMKIDLNFFLGFCGKVCRIHVENEGLVNYVIIKGKLSQEQCQMARDPSGYADVSAALWLVSVGLCLEPCDCFTCFCYFTLFFSCCCCCWALSRNERENSACRLALTLALGLALGLGLGLSLYQFCCRIDVAVGSHRCRLQQ